MSITKFEDFFSNKQLESVHDDGVVKDIKKVQAGDTAYDIDKAEYTVVSTDVPNNKITIQHNGTGEEFTVDYHGDTDETAYVYESKTKPFDGVKMVKLKKKEYKLGKKKLSTKLKNIKMLSEFLNEKVWKITMDLSAEFEKYNIDEIDENPEEFKKIKEAVCSQLSKYFEQVKTELSEEEAGKFDDLVGYLKNSDDAEEWDNNFSDLYDWADDNEVFITS